MKTEECNELTKIDKGIENEMFWRKFEIGQTVYFGLSFCRFVEKFSFFDTSTLGYIEVILITKCIFPSESLLIFIPDCNVNLNFNSHWKKEWMMRNIKSIYLVNTNDRMNCHPVFFDFFYAAKLESFLERKRDFFSSVFDVEMEIIFVLKTGGSDSYYCFVLQMNEFSESQMFLSNESESENESIVNEKGEIETLLKLSGGSRIEDYRPMARIRKVR
jgi:hypothetical protein